MNFLWNDFTWNKTKVQNQQEVSDDLDFCVVNLLVEVITLPSLVKYVNLNMYLNSHVFIGLLQVEICI